METTNTSDPLQRLKEATKTAIADLNPDLKEPASRAVRGVVTITWPYNSVKGTFAFILAEPDYRLRRSKGQVRVNLSGPSAKAAGESGLSSGDEVLVGLDGAEWEPEEAKKRLSLSGAGISWQLKFSEKLLLQVASVETGDTRFIAVDHPPPAEPPTEPQLPVQVPPTEIDLIDIFPFQGLESLTPPSKTHVARLKDGEYESPAFVKRARISYGSLFEDGYDIFEDDGGAKGRGRKRMKFGRESGAWRYSSQLSSPEPASPQNNVSSPPKAEMKAEMNDEGCQTMDIDFPMPLTTQSVMHTEEVRKSPKPTSSEEPPRQGMVDHGVQDDFHDGWSAVMPTSLPPFAPSVELPSGRSELPLFQANLEFGAASDDFQHGWDHGHVNLPPQSYPHGAESPTSDLVNAYVAERPIALEVTGSGNRTRSPSELSNLAIEHVEHNPSNDLPTDDSYPLPGVPQATIYPPLDLDNEEQTNPNLQDAHLDYPESYLDDDQSFPHAPVDIEQGTFVPRVSAEADAGSSWATINHPTQATSAPRINPLGSADGESPNTALVIGESDSDGDAPPPTAAEETVEQGGADALEMYDEAEVEDEVDAAYSDDDEPEYDADEIGGDYDTRIYEGPDDDEDDSHDDDLRPHNLEPEFNDGESWDEEDEDGESAEYESDYEMDDEQEKPQQQQLRPAPQSTPQVIDLISSSDDEEEDNEAPQQPPARKAPDSSSQGQPQASSRSMPTQLLTQGDESESEEEEIEGDDDDEESNEYGEDEDEDEDAGEIKRQSDAGSIHSSDRSETESSAGEDEGIHQPLQKHRETEGIPEDENVESPGVRHEPTGPESSHADEAPIDKESSQPSATQLVLIQSKDDEIMEDTGVGEEEGDDNAPHSAAEGLEILSRAVESESNANNQATTPDKMQEDIVADMISPKASEPPADHAQESQNQVEYESQDAQEDDEPVDLVSTTPNAPSHLQQMVVDDEKRVEVVAPSSPPLTQSFKSQPADEDKMEIIMEETITIVESQVPIDQLLTPRDTQLTGDTTVVNPPLAISMDVDEPEEVNDTTKPTETVHEVSSIPEHPVDTKQLMVVEDAAAPVEEPPVEPAVIQRQWTPSEDIREITQPNDLLVSPSLSFQTQVDADDMIQTSSVQASPKVDIEVETEVETHSDVEVEAPGAGGSFRSQMELDDELQASIMEGSQYFNGEPNPDMEKEHEADEQFEDHEDETSIAQDEDITNDEPETQELVSRPPSPDLGTPIQQQKNIQQDISTVAEVSTLEDEYEEDPSVQLARAANASRRNTGQRDTTPKNVDAQRKRLASHESSAPEVDDSSVQLARASRTKLPQVEEDNSSMTAAKLGLVRHLRELPDCTSLKFLRQYLQKKLDVIAVAMMQPPEPRRAKGGPREYMMSFTITDQAVGPNGVVEVQIYRPHKETLPIVKAGDIVLLRNFTVVSLKNKGFGLRTNDESSWAIFDHEGQPAQIKGPPVEYGDKEETYVAYMRTWFNLLDEKSREKLERANKKIIDAGKAK
ncbi:hypothetical protein F4677DRAFT_415585 [Hypoxylon crocopeplum]|nr:hypothetical protein F4677DRAFT_415585 [Hypoxylon crocopeplum]